MVYYMDSLWCAFAVHTAWNFTQNILFGLPNSGINVPYSVFKLDAATARDSFAYNVGFGIEGTLLADVVLLVACVLLYLWGRKHGKKSMDVWAETYIISILRKRHQVTSGAVQLCIRPRNGKRDIPCNYSGQNEPYRLHPY